MYFILLEIKERIKEILVSMKNLIGNIFIALLVVLSGLFFGVRYIVFKILCVIMTITNIGFFVGLFLLYKNIKECLCLKIEFTNTEYFYSMLVLLALHFIVFTLSIIVRPKDI